MTDILATLLRMRQIAVAEALRDFSGTIIAEDNARAAILSNVARVEEETIILEAVQSSDDAGLAFSAWHLREHDRATELQSAAGARQSDVDQSRAILVAAKTNVRVANVLIASRNSNKSLRENRDSQRLIDQYALSVRGQFD